MIKLQLIILVVVMMVVIVAHEIRIQEMDIVKGGHIIHCCVDFMVETALNITRIIQIAMLQNLGV